MFEPSNMLDDGDLIEMMEREREKLCIVSFIYPKNCPEEVRMLLLACSF